MRAIFFTATSLCFKASCRHHKYLLLISNPKSPGFVLTWRNWDKRYWLGAFKLVLTPTSLSGDNVIKVDYAQDVLQVLVTHPSFSHVLQSPGRSPGLAAYPSTCTAWRNTHRHALSCAPFLSPPLVWCIKAGDDKEDGSAQRSTSFTHLSNKYWKKETHFVSAGLCYSDQVAISSCV